MKKFELKKVLGYFYANYANINCPKTSKFCACITKRGLKNIQKKKIHF